MAIPDPPKAGSPLCALRTGGWNPKTPEINNFFIPEIALRGGYGPAPCGDTVQNGSNFCPLPRVTFKEDTVGTSKRVPAPTRATGDGHHDHE